MHIEPDDVQSFISKRLHSLMFPEEFVFARNQFSPPSGSELELADAVVMLGDALLIFQIKERSADDVVDEDGERRWFHSKVLGKATKQIRDTLRYLQTYDEICVPNERGRVFNLAARQFTEIFKVVVYMPSPTLPHDCRSIRNHTSNSAGLIHIVEAQDYLEILRTLRVPEEVVRYFRYREMVMTRFSPMSTTLPEPAIAGHFIGGDPDVSPDLGSASHLYRLVQDDEEWDLTPLMRGLHNHLTAPGMGDDYYGILMELSKLPRSMWRKIKERIRLCVQTVKRGEFAGPYRITDPGTDCGFVFVPVDPETSGRPDWPEIRVQGLQNLALAHKYDQRLSKCIGIMIVKDGEYFDVLWCFVSHEWVEDREIQEMLDRSFPFRPLKQSVVQGYRFVQGQPDLGPTATE
jgi:hypothetical protein